MFQTKVTDFPIVFENSAPTTKKWIPPPHHSDEMIPNLPLINLQKNMQQEKFVVIKVTV
jgi:hypothetical protein